MIFYECYADECVLRFLGLRSKELAGGHSLGRSFVSKKLQKNKGSIGLIDEDPNSPLDPFLNKLLTNKVTFEDDSLLLAMDKEADIRLAVIKPDIETFAVRLAKQNRIDLRKHYNLSMVSAELHELLSPRRNINQREKFSQFLIEVSHDLTLVNLKDFIIKR